MGRARSTGLVLALFSGAAAGCAAETFLVGEDQRPGGAPAGARGGAGGAEPRAGAGGAPAHDPCARLECAPGRCMLDETGAARCACPPGFLRDHARCVACRTLTGALPRLVLERATVPVRLALSVAGEPLPSGASVSLREVETGLALVLEPGRVTHVPAGRYQVRYAGRIEPPFAAPANRSHPLAVVELVPQPGDAQAPRVLEFDLRATRVTGELMFSHEHAQFARLLHLDLAGVDSAASARFLDETRTRFEVLVLDGSYELALAGSGELEPGLRLGRWIEARGEPIELGRIDVPVGRVDVRLSASGGAEGYATTLYLRGAAGLFRLASLGDGRHAGSAPYGAYELFHVPVHGPAPVAGPRAEQAALARVQVAAPLVTLPPLALTLVRASGRVRVGDIAADGAVQSIQLRSAERAPVALQLGDDGRYSAWIEPGSYRAFYRCAHPSCRDGRIWPANREAALGEIEVAGGGGHDIEVPVAEIAIDVTEGLAPGQGVIGLWDAGDGAGRWSSPAYVEGPGPRLALRVVQGRYAVVYQRGGRGQLVWRLGALTAQGDRIEARWNLPTVRVGGTLALGPEPSLRHFRLENLDRGYLAFEVDARGAFEVDVPAGQYLLRAGVGQTGSALGCFAFDGAPPAER